MTRLWRWLLTDSSEALDRPRALSDIRTRAERAIASLLAASHAEKVQ